jgi:hypothetical protein
VSERVGMASDEFSRDMTVGRGGGYGMEDVVDVRDRRGREGPGVLKRDDGERRDEGEV